jgi:transporter family protein
MAWAIVVARGKLPLARAIDRGELGFLAASGVATGASWLFYYYAVQSGQVSVVVQIDKLSILVSVAFARLAFGERLSRPAAVGLALIVAGTLAMTVWS